MQNQAYQRADDLHNKHHTQIPSLGRIDMQAQVIQLLAGVRAHTYTGSSAGCSCCMMSYMEVLPPTMSADGTLFAGLHA